LARATTTATRLARSSRLSSTISAEQLAQLRKLVAEAKADTARFCRYMKVARLEDLPAARFQAATAALEVKRLREAQSQESKMAKGGA
jgi:hypothetical protein